VKEAILYDDIYALFSMTEDISESVSLVSNVYILDADGSYVTDAKVIKDLPDIPSSSMERFTLQLENKRVIGHIIYIIDTDKIHSTVLKHSLANLLFIIPIIIAFIFVSIKLILFFTRPLNIISNHIKVANMENLPIDFNLPDYTSAEVKNLSEVLSTLSSELDKHIKQNIEHEKALAKEDRLAAIGSMSAGLAHELRNPAMSLQMLMHSIRNGDDKVNHEDIEVMEREVSRIASTVNEFLKISKPITIHKGHTSTHNLKDELSEHVSRVLNRAIRLEFTGEDFTFVSDHLMLFNILENLLNNSYEAGSTVCRIEFSKDEEIVKIIFSDNGMGIPEKNMDKVFHPFYTTKKSGTGLGMSMCEKMASALGGSIALDREVDKGAQFIIKVKDLI
jgi:signal transduction histidine kinase